MSLNRISAWGGCYTIDDTNTHTTDGNSPAVALYHQQIIAHTDSEIEAMTVVDGGGDTVTYALQALGLNGTTIAANVPIILPLHWFITSIKLASGKVTIYK